MHATEICEYAIIFFFVQQFDMPIVNDATKGCIHTTSQSAGTSKATPQPI